MGVVSRFNGGVLSLVLFTFFCRTVVAVFVTTHQPSHVHGVPFVLDPSVKFVSLVWYSSFSLAGEE